MPDGKLEKRSDDSLRIIKCGDQRVFVVDSYRKDLISAIRDKFGADVEIIPPRAASARLEELVNSKSNRIPTGVKR